MESMNISLPQSLSDFVQARVTEGGYGSASEYISVLIRADQIYSAHAVLEAAMIKGVESGPAKPMTEDDWRDIRQEVRRRWEAHNGQAN